MRWEAAHFLPDYRGDCNQLHGHSWEAWITVSGVLHSKGVHKGMVMDMGMIGEHFKTVLEAKLDHRCMNDTLPGEYQPPTTENVARYLMASYLGFGFPVVKVTVRETENQTATVTA